MTRAICYDMTRLLTRVLNVAPNGIDRIDSALCRHVLFNGTGLRFGTTSTGFGSRLLSHAAARDALEGIETHWRETSAPDADLAYSHVVARIKQTSGRAAYHALAQTSRLPPTLGPDVKNGIRWLRRHGLPFFSAPGQNLPKSSIYLNVSQFPLWVARSFEWLERRPDIKAVFFIHDLLPISMPEYFREAEFERHRARMANFVRFGAAALVTTTTVADALAAHVATLGRRDLPVFIAPTPIAPVFSEPRVLDPDLEGHPYFVLCSTIEPRKNHLMILAAWREMVQRYGPSAPKLVLAGTRGWKYGLIVDLIERSPPLRDTVIAVSGLSTPGLKRLFDNALAVLMPSFAEGYGLPVHEALATGTPVIASDIPVFREINSPDLTLLSPLNGEAWLETVRTFVDRGRPGGEPPSRRSQNSMSWAGYFERLDAFLSTL